MPCRKRMGKSLCPPRTWRTRSANPKAESTRYQGEARNATAEAASGTEYDTEKDDPNERVDKVVETYAEKVSADGVNTFEVSRAGVSASTTSAFNKVNHFSSGGSGLNLRFNSTKDIMIE